MGGSNSSGTSAASKKGQTKPRDAVGVSDVGLTNTPSSDMGGNAMLSSPDGGLIFASSSRGNYDFDDAQGHLKSPEQDVFKKASGKIDKMVGLDGRLVDQIGAWEDGAENATYTEFDNVSQEDLRAVAAMRGLLGEQKQVLIFKPDGKSKNAAYEFTVPTDDYKTTHELLLKKNLPFHTLIPDGKGRHRVVIYSDANETVRNNILSAMKFLKGRKYASIRGNGEFMGDQKDKKTRFGGRKSYEPIIQEYLKKHPEKAKNWYGLLNSWKFGANKAPDTKPPKPIVPSPVVAPANTPQAVPAPNPSVAQATNVAPAPSASVASTVNNPSVVTPPSSSTSMGGNPMMQKSGGSSPQMIQSADRFHEAIEAAKNSGLEEDIKKGTYGTKASKFNGQYVYTYPKGDYGEFKKILLPDNSAGVAVKPSGDIVSVFRNPTSTRQGVLDELIPMAVANGGNHLDCFNGFLPGAYAKFGFRPVARIKFDPKEAPEHWNYERDGQPDIVFMVHDGSSPEAISAALEEWKKLPPEEQKARAAKMKADIQKAITDLPYSHSYDDAVATQNNQILRPPIDNQ